MKPIGSAQGKGIFLFSRLSEIAEWRTDFRQAGRGDKDKDGGDRAKSEVEAYIVSKLVEMAKLELVLEREGVAPHSRKRRLDAMAASCFP